MMQTARLVSSESGPNSHGRIADHSPKAINDAINPAHTP